MIPAALLYLGQMQLALLLLLAVYYAALRRLTFHALNRTYLLGSLALAALYPALDLSALSLRPAPTATPPLLLVLPSEPVATTGAAAADAGLSAETWWWVAYGAGTGLLLTLLLVQAAALWRLHRNSRPVVLERSPVRAVAAPISPFSFGRQIYLNPARHAAEELPAILLHERVHVRQWHSLDTVLAHLHRALAWASPAAWLWLRAVQENLEFIADAAVLRESNLPAKAYQYNLLRLSSLGAVPAFATPFTFITLKNRIQMMNTPESSPRQLGRYAAGLSLLLLLAGACATPKSVELPQPTADTKAAAALEKLTYVLDGRPSTQAEVFAVEQDLLTLHVYRSGRGAAGADLEAMRRDYGSRLDDGVMFAFTKSGAGSPAVRELQAKYKIQLPDPAVQAKKNEEMAAMYGKLREGQGLTDAEIGGRLILIDERPATAAELRALPAGTIGSFATSDGPDKVHGEAGRHGVLRISTKRPESAAGKAEPTLAGGLNKALTDPLYYVDGQPSSKAVVEQLSPADISSMWVLKNDKARELHGFTDIGRHDIIMLVTKANEHSEPVQRFIEQHNIKSDTTPADGQRPDVKRPGPGQPTGALYPGFLKTVPATDRC